MGHAFAEMAAAKTFGVLDEDAASVRILRARCFRDSLGFGFSFLSGEDSLGKNLRIQLAKGRFLLGGKCFRGGDFFREDEFTRFRQPIIVELAQKCAELVGDFFVLNHFLPPGA